MQFAAALSTEADTRRAIDEVVSSAAPRLDGPPDLAVLFVSPHHAASYDTLAGEIVQRTGAPVLWGATGESIAGGGQEIEDDPALALWLARLPGVTLEPMHLRFEQTADGGAFHGWSDALPETWPGNSTLLLLADPFTFPADLLLERLNRDQPGVKVLGGMASAGSQPGENRLFLGQDALEEGAVALWLHGPLAVHSLVSQGCRPIGQHYVVTRAERNIIHEVGGQAPLVQLREVFPTLSDRQRELVQRGLHVGIVTNEYQDSFGRGDFLIRNVIGADPKTGAVAVGDFVRAGRTVQFHVRDADTADEDLRELAAQLRANLPGDPASSCGALLFTCNGRGTRLFPEPHHDALALHSVLGELPLAGFFAQGEIGPIGRQNFLHGFTASVAVFAPA